MPADSKMSAPKSQRRKRKRVSEGVYRDQWGFSASVRGGGQRAEKRFPPGTSLKTIKAWRDETRVSLRKAAGRATRSTFANDAAQYLLAVGAMPTFRQRRRDIRLWIAEFGQRRRDSITTPEIDTLLSRWLGSGLAASTVKHRRTALLHLWHRLDGTDAANPVRRSLMPVEPEPEPRGLPYSTVQKILGAMPDQGQAIKGQARDAASKTKTRFALMAYTGFSPATIMRLRPHDVRWDAGAVFVRGRRKGKGTKGQTIPLTSAGLSALRRFDELDCWGPFSTSSAWKSFQTACRKVGLSGLRPYDLRHTFGTAVYAATGDLRATQKLLGHASRTTTDRYTLAAVPERLQVAVGQVERLQQSPKMVAVPGGSTRPVAVNSRK